MVGAPCGEVGVETVAHYRNGGGVAVEHGDFRHHALGGRHLCLSAERHHHGACAYGAVEHLDKTFLRAYVEVGEGVEPCLADVAAVGIAVEIALFLVGHRHADVGLLMGSVGVDESARQVDNLFAAPGEYHTRVFGNGGHDGGFEVLLFGVGQHFVHVFGVHHYCHTLLRFGDGQLGAVEAGVFLGNFVEVDKQSVGQLAYGHGDAAGAEVVTFLNERRHLFAAEHALDLTFCGRVAFLYLGTAGGKRFGGVRLGSACGTADAVAACASAEQYDDVARVGGEAFHATARSRGNHGTYLHTFGHVVGVVYLVHQTGGEANLVAVRAVARCGGGNYLTLRQFSCQSLVEGLGGVGGAGNAHGLIHVGASRKGVADTSAQTGGGSAERLYLGGVVVCLVLEIHKPFLYLAVDFDGDDDAAGVDLIGHLLVLQLACFAQTFPGKGADVHQRHVFVGAAGVLFAVVGEITLEGAFDKRTVVAFVEGDVFQLGGEGGVAAVVAPVGVEHADFRHGGVAVLLAAEIVLYVFEIVESHCQSETVVQGAECCLVHVLETVEDGHVGGLVEDGYEGVGFLLVGKAAVDGVHAVFHHGVALLLGEVAGDDVGGGRFNQRFLVFVEQLDALLGGVGALVELSGQVFHREDEVVGLFRERLLVHHVHRRFREDGDFGVLIGGVGHVFDVVAYQHTHFGGLDAEVVFHLVVEFGRFHGVILFLFYINAPYVHCSIVFMLVILCYL